MPQAFGSFGAQVGTGNILVRETTTLFFAEALEVWVVAAAPVRTRTTTNARTICFMEGILWNCSIQLIDKMTLNCFWLATGHTTGVRVVRSAGRNWQHAGAGDGDLVLRGGAGGLGCGGYTGENEDDNECANDMFHSVVLPKLYLCKKISLDKPDGVTIRYKLD
jgi:hypothetical protein